MSQDTISSKMGEKKTYTQEELDGILEMHTAELKEKAKGWVRDKAEIRANELVPALVESRALEVAQTYIEKSPGAKKFEEDKLMITELQQGGAIPGGISVQQAMVIKMTCDSLGISFVDGLKGMCFINGNLFIYGPVFLSLITKNKYRIKFIVKTEEEVKIELSGPNGVQEGHFTRKQAEKAGLWKSVYLKYPMTMLTYKAVRDAQKWLCPEVLGAIPLVEEADEYPASNVNKALDTSGTTQNKLEEKKEELKNKYKNLISNQKEDENI